MMARSRGTESVPLTFDLTEELNHRLRKLRAQGVIRSISDGIRIAITQYDFAGYKPVADDRKQVSVRLSPADRKLLGRVAKAGKSSVGAVIRAALADLVDNPPQSIQTTNKRDPMPAKKTAKKATKKAAVKKSAVKKTATKKTAAKKSAAKKAVKRKAPAKKAAAKKKTAVKKSAAKKAAKKATKKSAAKKAAPAKKAAKKATKKARR